MGLGVRLFSHSAIRWLAVRFRALGPKVASAGQGSGSFLVLSEGLFRGLGVQSSVFVSSELVRGLVRFDAEEGTVLVSDGMLDVLEPCDCGLSQVSQASLSLEAVEDTFDTDFAWRTAGLTFFVLTGVACWLKHTPFSVQNEGSANAGAEASDNAEDVV